MDNNSDNSQYNSDTENQSQERRPRIPKKPSVFDIPDLTNLVADFCDDDALSKLSRVNRDIRKMIVEESKDRYIRILEYKYVKVCMLLESLMDKLHQGQQIDFEMLQEARDGLRMGLSSSQNSAFDHLSIYRRILLNQQTSQNQNTTTRGSIRPLRGLFSGFAAGRQYRNFNNQNQQNLARNQGSNASQTNNSRDHLNGNFMSSVNNINLAMPQNGNISQTNSTNNSSYIQSNNNSSMYDYMSEPNKISQHQGKAGVFLPKNEEDLSDIYKPDQNWVLEDSLYESLLRKRAQLSEDFQRDIEKKRELERQCFEAMYKLNDQSASLSDAVDSFVNYKINRYKDKIYTAVRKIKGDQVYDSDLLNEDALETQFFLNSLTDKIIEKQKQSFLLEPFRQTYVLKELKNVLTESISLGTPDYTRFSGLSNDFQSDLEKQKREMDRYYRIEEKINQSYGSQEYEKMIEMERESVSKIQSKLKSLDQAKIQHNLDTHQINNTDNHSHENEDHFTIKVSSNKNRSSSMDDQYNNNTQSNNAQYYRNISQNQMPSMNNQQSNIPLWKKLLFMPVYGQLLNDPMAMHHYRNQQLRQDRLQNPNNQKK